MTQLESTFLLKPTLHYTSVPNEAWNTLNITVCVRVRRFNSILASNETINPFQPIFSSGIDCESKSISRWIVTDPVSIGVSIQLVVNVGCNVLHKTQRVDNNRYARVTVCSVWGTVTKAISVTKQLILHQLISWMTSFRCVENCNQA